MTCTHCGAPSTQPSGPCATCAPPAAWPQSDTDAPSGLVAPPTYSVNAATPDLEVSPSGLPQFGGLAAPAPDVEQLGDFPQHEPAPFAPPTPADPHLESQYSATLPAANAPGHAAARTAGQDDDTVPIPSTAPVAVQYSAAPVSATAPVAAPYSASVSATPGHYGATVPAAPAPGHYGATVPATPEPGHYGAAPTPADPTSHYNPLPPAPVHTAGSAAPAPPYGPSNAQQFPTPPAPQYAATPPYAPPYGTASPYGPGNLPYRAPFPGHAAAGSAPSVLSIVAIVLAAFALAVGFFVNPFLPAAGAVVCASIGLRRGERLAKLGLVLGIVAAVYSLGIVALNVIALVLL